MAKSRRFAFARLVMAAAGLAAIAVILPAGSASATPLISPSFGPTTGGTTVSVAAAALGFTQVAQGLNMGYGLSGDGHVYSWGANSSDELGDGTTAASSTPVQVLQGAIPAGVSITQIAAGWLSGFALGSDGKVYAWGANFDGQLGDGTTTARNAPVAVDVSGIPAGVRLTQVAAGFLDAYAVGSDGNIYSWGYNHDGELGDGSNTDHHAAVVVSTAGLPAGVGFTQVAAGQITAFGIGTDGHVYSWGSDVVGALGSGGTGDRNSPAAISAGAIPAGVAITQVAGGQEGGYALGNNGSVYAWGSNMFGDLGDGTGSDSSVPVAVAAGQIPAGVTITAISGGSSTGYGVGSDGNVYSWGNGGNGQLGNGSGSSSTSPVLVAAGEVPSGVAFTSVSGGYHSAIALGNDGNVYGWGDNNGDLGDGTTTQQMSPVLGANAALTSVSFGGVSGTGLVDPPGVTTVITPAHSSGTVSVTVAGSINGGSTTGQATSRLFPAAFTFQAALAPTGVPFAWWLLAAALAAILAGAFMAARKPRRSSARRPNRKHKADASARSVAL